MAYERLMLQLWLLSRILIKGPGGGTSVIVSGLLVNVLTCGDYWGLKILLQIVSFV
jgi:hypothetical protein